MEREAMVTVVQPSNVAADLEALERRFVPGRLWVFSRVAAFGAFVAIGVLLALSARLNMPFLGVLGGAIVTLMLFSRDGLLLGTEHLIVVRGGRLSLVGIRGECWERHDGADFVLKIVTPGLFRGANLDVHSSASRYWEWLDIHDDGTLVARRTLDGRKVHAKTLRELVDCMIADMEGGRAA